MNNFYARIPGWMSHTDAKILYDLSFNCTGAILEIGFFLGKSTSIICDAIKNSSHNNDFDSYDMDFKNEEEFINFYKNIHKNVKVPKLFIDYVINRNRSTLESASENLSRFDLLKFVNLNSGDFKSISNKKYDLIFCDVMHDKNEIELNLSDVKRLSNKNCIWAVHDIKNYNPKLIANEPNIKFLMKKNNLGVFLFE